MDKIIIPAGSQAADAINRITGLHRQSITAETFALRDHIRTEAGWVAFELIDLVAIDTADNKENSNDDR